MSPGDTPPRRRIRPRDEGKHGGVERAKVAWWVGWPYPGEGWRYEEQQEAGEAHCVGCAFGEGRCPLATGMDALDTEGRRNGDLLRGEEADTSVGG